MVTDGVDGLLVPARDAAALARAIARLQDDPALAARLGEAARAKALAEYDERNIVARTLEVYRGLVGELRVSGGIAERGELNDVSGNSRLVFWRRRRGVLGGRSLRLFRLLSSYIEPLIGD